MFVEHLWLNVISDTCRHCCVERFKTNKQNSNILCLSNILWHLLLHRGPWTRKSFQISLISLLRLFFHNIWSARRLDSLRQYIHRGLWSILVNRFQIALLGLGVQNPDLLLSLSIFHNVWIPKKWKSRTQEKISNRIWLEPKWLQGDYEWKFTPYLNISFNVT